MTILRVLHEADRVAEIREAITVKTRRLEGSRCAVRSRDAGLAH
jgi:hypothetical protein